VVVLSELPEEQDTLVLRLLGREGTLRQALLECAGLERDSPLERRLEPLLVAFKPHILQDPDLQQESHMNVLEQVQAMYDRWEQETADRGRREGRQEGMKEGHKEGRKEGRKEGHKEGRKEGEAMALLRLLEQRFGTLPETVTARVTQASMHDIECWLDRVLHAASLDAVFAR
jgi:flagellar biosynthesis/type III secretory pathway protein FliH